MWREWLNGLGAIAGGLVIGQFGRDVQPRNLVGWGSIAAGLLLLVQFTFPWLPLALAIAFLVGVPATASGAGAQTLVQTGVADEYRGRVFGALGASGSLLSLSGAVLGGALAEVAGIVPMLSAAALTVLARALALAMLPATGARRAAERGDR